MQLLNESTVLPEEIDSLGHMNVRHYMTRMEQANRVLLAGLGIQEDPRAGRFLRSTDTYTRFRREQFEGATLHTIGGLLEVAEGGMRSYVEITNPDTGDVAATFIVTTALIDSATRRPLPVPMPDKSVAYVEVPDFARPRSLSLDAVHVDISLEELDARVPTIEGTGGMMSGRRETTIEEADVDEAGWLREDVELMFLPFVKMAQEAGVKPGPPVFETADGRRIGWAVMETRTRSFGQPRLGDRLAYFSADVALEEKTRVSRRWALDQRTERLLGISDTVGICIDLDARRAVTWPDDLRQQIERHLQPDLA